MFFAVSIINMLAITIATVPVVPQYLSIIDAFLLISANELVPPRGALAADIQSVGASGLVAAWSSAIPV